MWVFTSTGFISAVRKYDRPNVITVRSRDRRSLERTVITFGRSYFLTALIKPVLVNIHIAGLLI